MNTSSKTPILILNGFLGSGKTTLFRKLLAQSNKKDLSVCAIVNDMSELDVDGELIADTNIVEANSSIFESISSCILSSQKGIEALDLALNRLLAHQNPQLVIIETSGSSHPLPLIEYFKNQTSVKLVGVFALVDSLMMAHDYSDGQNLIPLMQQNMTLGKRDTTNLLIEQILFCSHLFLPKSDRLEKDKLAKIASTMQSINPYVSIHSMLFGNLDIESLLELPEYDYFKVAQLIEELKPVLASEEKDDQPYDLVTGVIKDERPFHPQRLWQVCHQYLGEKIYRSKGFFWLASRDKHALLWNQASGDIRLEINGTWRAGVIADPNHGISEMEIQHLKTQLSDKGRFGDRRCELTVIGDETQVDHFTEALKSCFLTDEEIARWFEGEEFDDPWPKNIVKQVN